MSTSKTIFTLVALTMCFSAVSCAPLHFAARSGSTDPLVVAHAYRRNAQNSSVAPVVLEPQVTSARGADPEDAYEKKIQLLFNHRDFDQLEKEAHDARTRKVRFRGGVWKLYMLYLGVTKLADIEPTTEAAWDAHVSTAKIWATSKPNSATAQLALAETYVNYAWFARGSGYADSVTDDGWKLFGERIELAKSTLLKAAQLREKCPFWYEVMQHVALAQGWDKPQARALMEEAVLFEPDFYAYYREYAHYLDPKWYGTGNQAGAFAEEMWARYPGQKGAFLYFEIASLMTCQCGPDPARMQMLSWPKVKAGYIALGQLYGVSNLKANRYAYMAYRVGQRDEVRGAFALIGDDWVPETWRDRRTFDLVKAWAEHP